jgi:isoleucyl-tRNA synthetase
MPRGKRCPSPWGTSSSRRRSSAATGRRFSVSGSPPRTIPATSASPTKSFSAWRKRIAGYEIPPGFSSAISAISPPVTTRREGRTNYQFHTVYHTLHNFCAVDLSAFYLDILKDRLYVEAPDSPGRRAAQTVLHEILESLVLLMAPIMSFTAEEVWRQTGPASEERESVFLASFPQPGEDGEDGELLARWSRLQGIRGEANKALEEARRAQGLGQSLAARLTVTGGGETIAFLASFGPSLKDIFIVSEVELVEGDAPAGGEVEVTVSVAPAEGGKCERCWIFDRATGRDERFPGTCPRCAGVLHALDWKDDEA